MRDGGVLRDDGGWMWEAWALEKHERSMNGLCTCGHSIRAWITGDELAIQHGENPEHVRFFTLDDLDGVGLRWCDATPMTTWFETIHQYERSEVDGQ